MFVTVKAHDDVCIEQVGGYVTMKGWMWIEQKHTIRKLDEVIGVQQSELAQRDAALDVLRDRIGLAIACLMGENANMEQLQLENSKLHTECGHLQADLSSLRQELDGVLDMIGDPGPQRCSKSLAAVQAEVRQSRSQVSQPPLTPGETQ